MILYAAPAACRAGAAVCALHALSLKRSEREQIICRVLGKGCYFLYFLMEIYYIMAERVLKF